MLNTPCYPLLDMVTPTWTEDIRNALDERNILRLKCLPLHWQRHVMFTYSSGGDVRDLQKHVSGTIGGVRRLIFGGMTRTEAERLQDLAATGVRVSYMPCHQYGERDSCRYGESCTHPHVEGYVGDGRGSERR